MDSVGNLGSYVAQFPAGVRGLHYEVRIREASQDVRMNVRGVCRVHHVIQIVHVEIAGPPQAHASRYASGLPDGGGPGVAAPEHTYVAPERL